MAQNHKTETVGIYTIEWVDEQEKWELRHGTILLWSDTNKAPLVAMANRLQGWQSAGSNPD